MTVYTFLEIKKEMRMHVLIGQSIKIHSVWISVDRI